MWTFFFSRPEAVAGGYYQRTPSAAGDSRAAVHGSKFAEHGVQPAKREEHLHVKPKAELQKFWAIKRVLDFKSLKNPGTVLRSLWACTGPPTGRRTKPTAL